MLSLYYTTPGGLLNPEVGVPGDFPQVALRVGEVAGVAAPKGVLGRFYQGGPGGHRHRQQVVHFRFGADVVGQGNAGKAAAFRRNSYVRGQAALGYRASQVPLF